LHNPVQKFVEKTTREEFKKKDKTDIVEITKEEYSKLAQKYEAEKGSEESSPITWEDNIVSEEKTEQVAKEQGPQAEVKKEESKPIQRRGLPKTEVSNVKSNCEKHFDYWGKLSETEKQSMISAIDHFDGTVPIYKENIHAGCIDQNCFYKGTNIVTCIPEDVFVCPVCGKVFQS